MGDWSPRAMDQTSARVPTTAYRTLRFNQLDYTLLSFLFFFLFQLFPSVQPEFLETFS